MKTNYYTACSTFLFMLFAFCPAIGWAQCTNAPVVEAVRNGDFEAGYLTKSGAGHVFTAGGPFDFQSDLVSAPTFTPPSMCNFSVANMYGVAKAEPGMPCTASPRQAYIGTDYINIASGYRDHTPAMAGNGFALVADFEGYTGAKYDAAGLPCAWRQDVTIVANETYYFSAWFANYNRDAGTAAYTNPTLRFVVIPLNPATGAIVGPRTVVGTATPTGQMNWQQFNGSWASTTNTRVMLLIEVEQANLTFANDLVIDDISFINSCVNLQSLPAAYIPDLGPDQSMCLTNGTLTLNSNASTTGGTQYWWYEVTPTATTLVNGATNTPTQTINQAGTYTVCVKNGAFPGSCTASSTIVVTNTMPPVTLANADICTSPNATLTASLTGASNVVYQWYKRPASVPDPGDVQSLTTNVTGTNVYGVRVSNPSVPGCGTVTSNDASVRSFMTTPSFVSFTGDCSTSKTFNLTSTSATGNNYAWWSASTGGAQIANGQSPSITFTAAQLPATVYVENYTSATAHVNQSTATGNNAGGPTYGEVNFTAQQNFILVSVWVRTIAACATNFTLSLSKNGAATGNTVTVPCNLNTWQEVFLNWPITADGSAYRINVPAGVWFNVNSGFAATSYGGIVNIIPATSGGSGAAVQWTIKTGTPCLRTPITLSCALAVEFLSMNARQVNNAVSIDWSAREDADKSSYIVQRSTDLNSGFITIGTVPVSGASAYVYTDYNPETGINYYRIIKGEEEGSMEYSEVMNVNFTSYKLLAVQPNPFNSSATITALNNGQIFFQQAIDVRVTDLSGKLLMDFSLEPGEQKEIGAELSAGTYIIHTRDGEVYKLVKTQ
ncbi:MAG: hypothetical protein K2X86_02395 [Cytophagaceae bacterium]|nr:hypothetical protein [Cytophagaceae bacterium]